MSWLSEFFKSFRTSEVKKDWKPVIVDIGRVTLCLYSDRSQFPLIEARKYPAYCYPDTGKIFIECINLSDDPDVLLLDFKDNIAGHELQEIAHRIDKRVIHPHKDGE